MRLSFLSVSVFFFILLFHHSSLSLIVAHISFILLLGPPPLYCRLDCHLSFFCLRSLCAFLFSNLSLSLSLSTLSIYLLLFPVVLCLLSCSNACQNISRESRIEWEASVVFTTRGRPAGERQGSPSRLRPSFRPLSTFLLPRF
jgi:hypothetical protein